MSIVLETDLQSALQYVRDYPHSPHAQTLVAAHAMQMAIEEATASWLNEEVGKRLYERAAANLARLLGEGNGS